MYDGHRDWHPHDFKISVVPAEIGTRFLHDARRRCLTRREGRHPAYVGLDILQEQHPLQYLESDFLMHPIPRRYHLRCSLSV